MTGCYSPPSFGANRRSPTQVRVLSVSFCLSVSTPFFFSQFLYNSLCLSLSRAPSLSLCYSAPSYGANRRLPTQVRVLSGSLCLSVSLYFFQFICVSLHFFYISLCRSFSLSVFLCRPLYLSLLLSLLPTQAHGAYLSIIRFLSHWLFSSVSISVSIFHSLSLSLSVSLSLSLFLFLISISLLSLFSVFFSFFFYPSQPKNCKKKTL